MNDLAALAAPITRARALATGLLVDTSAVAAFLGFHYPAGVTSELWDEGIARYPRKADSIAALQDLWASTAKEVARGIGKDGGGIGTTIGFVWQHYTGARMNVVLHCSIDDGKPVLTLGLNKGKC